MKVRKVVLLATVGRDRTGKLEGQKTGGLCRVGIWLECRPRRRGEKAGQNSGRLEDLWLGLLGSELEMASSRRQGGF